MIEPYEHGVIEKKQKCNHKYFTIGVMLNGGRYSKHEKCKHCGKIRQRRISRKKYDAYIIMRKS